MGRRPQSLRGKILAGYLALVTITAAVGIWAIYNFAKLNQVLAAVTKENYISVLAAENMIGAIERQDSAELLILLGEIRGGNDIYQMGQAEFGQWLDQEKRNITLPNEGTVVRQLTADYLAYDGLSRRLHDLAVAGNQSGARRLYLAEVEPLFKRIRSQLQSLLAMNNQALMDGNQRSKQSAWRAAVSTAVVATVAIMLGAFFGLGLSGAVVRPTIRLTEAVRRLREGNLGEEVAVTSRDEIGELAREFNSMVSRLRAYEEALTDKVVAEQQKALAIVRAVDDGIVLTDEERRVQMLNPAAENILKLAGQEAIGRTADQVLKQPVVDTMIETAIRTGEMPHNRTVVLEGNGRERFYDVEVVPLETKEARTRRGTAVGVSGTAVLLKDVSYFKRLEKAKSDFLSDVSHEIRTPLTSIAMGIGLLQESGALAALERERNLLGTVKEETARLSALVEELLELSRLESGRSQLRIEEVPFPPLLNLAVDALRPQAEAQGVDLVVEVRDNLPKVRLDPDKIRSVLGNLLTNALRYTPAGGRVGVKADLQAEDLTVSVSDNGPGIPPEAREKIFDRFYQIPERPGGQAGLGLTITKTIVQTHGGRIWVDSQAGSGATFSFAIPVAGPKNEAAPPPPVLQDDR